MADGNGGGGTTIWTVGHSNQPMEHLIDLLRRHGIEVLVDVRSAPYSRFAPQFNERPLKAAITGAGLKYLYLGRELGGRPDGDEYYDDDDHVNYEKVADADFFQRGVERLLRGAERYRVAIMCSEEDPLDCHRSRLVARVLAGEPHGVDVRHIRGDGEIQTEAELEARRNPPPPGGQLSMLEALGGGEVTKPWKSTRSVSRSGPPPTSSGR